MPFPPSNPRPLSQVDPCPGFRALLDLPYRFALEAHQTSTLGDLAACARDAASPESWGALYARSLLEGERILNSIDQKLDAQQQALNALDDPMEIRNRLAGAPRRGVERVVTDLRSALQRCSKDWLDRTRRQQEFVTDGTVPWFRDLFRWKELVVAHGVQISLDPTWWSQLERFVLDACTQWQGGVMQGFDTACQQVILDAIRNARPASTSLPSPPSPLPVADARLKLDTPVDERLIEIPNAVGMVLRSGRSLGTMGTFLFTVVAGVAVGDQVRAWTMKVSPLIMIIALFAAFYFAQEDRKLRRERGIESWRATAVQQMRAAVAVVLDRQHRALDRWIEARTEQWTRSVDGWFSADVEPQFVDADARAQEQVRQLKLQQARMQEEFSTLRSLRSQFSQTILPELRRRHHELAHAVATPPRSTGDSG
jgi:hypothetical protein